MIHPICILDHTPLYGHFRAYVNIRRHTPWRYSCRNRSSVCHAPLLTPRLVRSRVAFALTSFVERPLYITFLTERIPIASRYQRGRTRRKCGSLASLAPDRMCAIRQSAVVRDVVHRYRISRSPFLLRTRVGDHGTDFMLDYRVSHMYVVDIRMSIVPRTVCSCVDNRCV